MTKKVCLYCSEDDDRVPKLFEKDHIFGRNTSEETILACLNCHAKKTYYQNRLPPSVRKKSAKKLEKYIYGLNSIGATLILIGEKLVEFSEIVAKEMKRRDMIE